MPFSTYTELQAAIQRHVDNDNANFVAAIPDMITLAESWMRRHLHTREMECRSSTPWVPAGVTEEQLGIYDLPSDWGGHRSVEKVGDTVWILYWREIPALSGTVATNWLLDKHPDLYLYASLSHSEGFLKDDPRIGLWGQQADRILKEIEVDDEGERYSGGPIRARMNADRPWARSHPSDGRYEYLPPFDFFDLEASAPLVNDPRRYFTVTESFLRVWPKPALP